MNWHKKVSFHFCNAFFWVPTHYYQSNTQTKLILDFAEYSQTYRDHKQTSWNIIPLIVAQFCVKALRRRNVDKVKNSKF